MPAGVSAYKYVPCTCLRPEPQSSLTGVSCSQCSRRAVLASALGRPHLHYPSGHLSAPHGPALFAEVYHLHVSGKMWYEPSRWKPSERVETEGIEENNLARSNPFSSFGTQKFSPLLRKKKRTEASHFGVAKVFFYAPTTSLLPPGKSFRIEKRPFLE